MSEVLRGRVQSVGRGLPKVAVSDGLRVVQTDDDGRFELPRDAATGPFIFITPPGQHWTDDFYRPSDATEFVFELEPRDGQCHVGAYVTDLHLENRREHSTALMRATLDELAAMKPRPAFVVFGGDICLQGHMGDAWLELLAEFDVPYRNAVGNHEVMIKQVNPFAAYESLFGPIWYSFEVGEVHYVVLCGMTPSAENVGYTNVLGHVTERELAWLRADLALLPAHRPVVAFIHVPLRSTYCERRGTTIEASPWWVVDNADEVMAILAAHGTRLVLQGHLHENERILEGGIELVETVSICGRWWTAAEPPERGVCNEPRGYRLIEADGTQVTHRCLATAESKLPADAEFVGLPESVIAGPPLEVWVNVHDGGPATKVTLRVDDGESIELTETLYPGSIHNEPMGYVHHWRAELPTAGWGVGEHRVEAVAAERGREPIRLTRLFQAG